jgi:hypothetical protein
MQNLPPSRGSVKHRPDGPWRRYNERLREHQAQQTRERIVQLLERTIAVLERIAGRRVA